MLPTRTMNHNPTTITERNPAGITPVYGPNHNIQMNIIEQFIKEKDLGITSKVDTRSGQFVREFADYLTANGYEIVKREELSGNTGELPEPVKREEVKIVPSPRIDWCGDCQKEHGYDH